MRKSLTILVFTEIQIKTIMSYHILIRMSKKYLITLIFVKDVEQMELSSIAGGYIK